MRRATFKGFENLFPGLCIRNLLHARTLAAPRVKVSSQVDPPWASLVMTIIPVILHASCQRNRHRACGSAQPLGAYCATTSCGQNPQRSPCAAFTPPTDDSTAGAIIKPRPSSKQRKACMRRCASVTCSGEWVNLSGCSCHQMR